MNDESHAFIKDKKTKPHCFSNAGLHFQVGAQRNSEGNPAEVTWEETPTDF